MEYIYAAMLLHKLGKQIDEASIMKIIEAAGGKADITKVKALVAALVGVDIENTIKEASTFSVQAPVEAKAEKKEEKKPEEEKKSEEAAAAGLSALFG